MCLGEGSGEGIELGYGVIFFDLRFLSKDSTLLICFHVQSCLHVCCVTPLRDEKDSLFSVIVQES